MQCIGKMTEEYLKVLGSRPTVDLRIAVVKLQKSMLPLLSLGIRLCFQYSNRRFTDQPTHFKGKMSFDVDWRLMGKNFLISISVSKNTLL